MQASETFTIRSVAGFETGLVRLAAIDDTLSAVGRGNVWIEYGGNPVSPGGSAQGLLHNCSGPFERTDCNVYGTVTYDEPGTYSYTVSYDPAGVFAERTTLTGTILVEPPGNFVIVSVGDSVASGEGVPQLPIQGINERLYDDGGYWNDVASNYDIPGVTGPDAMGCHRSSHAGPVRAVRRIEQTNDVTFIHIACSGAKLQGPAQGDYDELWYKIGYISKINLQLAWVRERVPRIDVLILSGGANNVLGGFGSVVTTCVLNSPAKPCSDDDEFINDLRCYISGNPLANHDCRDDDGNMIQPLSFYYDEFDQWIDKRGTFDQQPSVVAIAEYFDPTHDEDGDFPAPGESVACAGGAIGPAEWKVLYDEMVVPLNNEVEWAAARNGWVHVDGIEEAFLRHGYCSSAIGDASGQSWVVKLEESLKNQGDEGGTSHPDSTGHGVYRDRIYEEILHANPPRTTATATTEGRPYVFGTWVNTDVTVTLTARNPIRESGVESTYYATDEPVCHPDTVAMGTCTAYISPLLISESGRNTVSFYSTSLFGAPETKALPVEVLIDKEPPVMTCDPTPRILWPPNKRMVDIEVDVTAVDEVSGPAEFWLDSISDSYADAGASMRGFEVGTDDVDGQLLADRHGNTPGRTYTLTYMSADHIGNTATCEAVVSVPHDQRP